MSIIDDLIAEADRQLTICNACRYCEGYCAVYPALATRRELGPEEVVHLSNLCHDCRACYYACMYAPPHEFAVNPPAILSRVRTESYSAYRGPIAKWVKVHLGGSFALLIASVCSLVLVGGVALTDTGSSTLFGAHASASPYQVITYGPLLAIVLVPFIASLWAMIRSAARYWKTTHGPLSSLFDRHALREASLSAAQLQNLKGGGGECYYPSEVPSSARRHLHGAVAYGFTLCLVATISAAIMQDGLSSQPPYGLVSVPVLCGLIGGVAMVIGCLGLIIVKMRSDRVPGNEFSFAADCGFIVALGVLGTTGVLVLVLRHSSAFGALLVVHLAAVILCFACAPYTKFVHLIYRYLALVKDSIERRDAELARRAVP